MDWLIVRQSVCFSRASIIDAFGNFIRWPIIINSFAPKLGLFIIMDNIKQNSELNSIPLVLVVYIGSRERVAPFTICRVYHNNDLSSAS